MSSYTTLAKFSLAFALGTFSLTFLNELKLKVNGFSRCKKSETLEAHSKMQDCKLKWEKP